MYTSLFNIFSYCFCTFAKCYCNTTNNYSNFCVISSVYMHVHTNGYIICFPCKIHAQNVWQWRAKSGHKDWLIATRCLLISRDTCEIIEITYVGTIYAHLSSLRLIPSIHLLKYLADLAWNFYVFWDARKAQTLRCTWIHRTRNTSDTGTWIYLSIISLKEKENAPIVNAPYFFGIGE